MFRDELHKNISQAVENLADGLGVPDDPFNTAVDLCGRDGSAYTVLRLQVYTEELLQFLQNCKGSVNFKWVLRMVFGTRYDEKLKNAAFRTLFRTGKIQLASDQKK